MSKQIHSLQIPLSDILLVLLGVACCMHGAPVEAQVPDVGPAVCAWKVNGVPCDEAREYCAEGCPLRAPQSHTTAQKDQQTSPDATPKSAPIPAPSPSLSPSTEQPSSNTSGGFDGLSRGATLSIILGSMFGVGVLLGTVFYFGGALAFASVAAGLVLLGSGLGYGIVEYENQQALKGDWHGRYVVTAPPACAGDGNGFESNAVSGDPNQFSFSVGQFTYTGSASGNTMEGTFIGPPCEASLGNELVTGTFFGGRIVPQ